tara:strand:+ start:189 stop:908 length:720 start_codon:yes stop_codon:yes gene_type:complete
MTDEESKNNLEIQSLMKELNPETLFSPEWGNRIFQTVVPTDSEQLENPKITMFKVENFLTRHECDEIISLYKNKTEDAAISNDMENYRTSKTCMINTFQEHEYIKKSISLDVKISNALNIHPSMSEGIEFEYFKSGDFFKPHVDFFSIEPQGQVGVEELMARGQRTWTVVIYLNNPEKGGDTIFDRLDLRIQPKAGLLVCWNNINSEGEITSDYVHEEEMVSKGYKAILTKYYRDKRCQ